MTSDESSGVRGMPTAARHLSRDTKGYRQYPAFTDGKVEAYMRALDHPLKAEMEAVRAIILGANDKMAERVKWNAPSFYYRTDFAVFHPRNRERVHVVMLFPRGLVADPAGLLEGDYNGRRMVYFDDMADVEAKRDALTAIVNDWIGLEEQNDE